MKSIFDRNVVTGFKDRLGIIDHTSKARWGKMTAYQMLKHCSENEKLLLREKAFRRLFIGRLFGKIVLKSNIQDTKPLKKNSPTHPDLQIKGDGNIDLVKREWVSMLDKYASTSSDQYEDFVHPFFGKMSREQVGIFAYKHIDHHLRQFGV